MAVTAQGAALTAAHRKAQAQLAADIVAVVRAAWPLLDPRDLEATVRRWYDVVLPLILDARYRSAATAALYLRSFAAAEAGSDATVVLAAAAAARPAVQTSLRVTGPVTIRALVAVGQAPDTAARTALTSVLGSVQRHVLNGGRETIDRTVAADRRIRGYARVSSASPCDWCAMLVSRGPIYRSASTADRGGYHDHCACTSEPVYAGNWTNPNGARADELSELWATSTAGLSGDQARNAFRRAYTGAT